MNAIRSIGGILSSVGTFNSVLQRIEVEGQTEIPDFSIDIAGQTAPLATAFKAVVDGTNGDTWLERVEARIGGSTLVSSGAVVRTEDVSGRGAVLDERVSGGRIEDLLRLAVKSEQPPLVGPRGHRDELCHGDSRCARRAQSHSGNSVGRTRSLSSFLSSS